MSNLKFVVGAILKNRMNQFAKILSLKAGIYALSGWMPFENAQQADVALIRFNAKGLERAGFQVVSSHDDSDTTESSENDAPSEEPKFERSKLEKMSAKDVKALATQIGVDADGTKKEVIARIMGE